MPIPAPNPVTQTLNFNYYRIPELHIFARDPSGKITASGTLQLAADLPDGSWVTAPGVAPISFVVDDLAGAMASMGATSQYGAAVGGIEALIQAYCQAKGLIPS